MFFDSNLLVFEEVIIKKNVFSKTVESQLNHTQRRLLTPDKLFDA